MEWGGVGGILLIENKINFKLFKFLQVTCKHEKCHFMFLQDIGPIQDFQEVIKMILRIARHASFP